MAFEIAHIYNRSLMKSMNISDSLQLLSLKMRGYQQLHNTGAGSFGFLVNMRYKPMSQEHEIQAVNSLSKQLYLAKFSPQKNLIEEFLKLVGVKLTEDEAYQRLKQLNAIFKEKDQTPKVFSYSRMHPFV